MKLRKELFIFLLIIIILVTISIFYKKSTNKRIYFEENGILLSISDGNGGTLSTVPDKDYYDVSVDCTNAEGSWDYNAWKIILKNITGNVTCDLSFRSISTSQTFAQYIASLAGTTQGEGQVVNENGYRYEGKNPDNYVWFNNELWRIIGVFGSSRHGVTNDSRTINGNSDTYLVKIIRAEILGGYSYDGIADETGNWPNTTLFRMLNGCYFYSLTGTNTTSISGSSVACSTYCIASYANSQCTPTSDCDFSAIGINNDGYHNGYRDFVQTATWYLGGPGDTSYDTYYPSNIYEYETNSSAVVSGRSVSVVANVGLMYLSDYAYSVLASSCARGSNEVDSGYNINSCSGNSWIFGQGDEWTITPHSWTSNVAHAITDAGVGSGYYVNYGYSVRPVVYLKSKTYKLSGTGTQSDPYIIGKDYEYNNTFNYSANVQTVNVVKDGYYSMEVWGASGGNANNSTSTNYAGGKGGYAKGVVHLNANDVLYIHTGGAGKGSSSNGIQTGGTNGGGNGGYYRGGSGGGATDIRINTDSLYARVIVAGGGGGSAYRSGYYGGAGGGTSGGDSTGYNTTYNAKGGTATAGGASGGYSGYTGTDGSFGQGGAANTISSTTNYGRSGGGGGGWYGGGGGGYRSSSNYYYYGQSGGGGGSSYTYSSSTASQVPSGWLLNSDYQMTSTSTTAGSNSGDGYAIVTYCGQSASDCS